MSKVKNGEIYILSPKIKFKIFKELQKIMIKDYGPTPEPKVWDKVLWDLLRKEKIYCWFAEDLPNDMGIGLEIPKRYKNWKMFVINNKKTAKNKERIRKKIKKGRN